MTSLTKRAPAVSEELCSSTSFATVAPSLVIRRSTGDFTITTFRPFGPIVAETAEDAKFRPVSINSCAWEPKDKFLFVFNVSYEWENIDFIGFVNEV
ncbi:MAG: hypothetical protein ACTS7D_01420 [Candidatus Hodgkinia cicadicola]